LFGVIDPSSVFVTFMLTIMATISAMRFFRGGVFSEIWLGEMFLFSSRRDTRLKFLGR